MAGASTNLCHAAEGHTQVIRVPLTVSLVVLIVLLVEDRQPLLATCSTSDESSLRSKMLVDVDTVAMKRRVSLRDGLWGLSYVKLGEARRRSRKAFREPWRNDRKSVQHSAATRRLRCLQDVAEANKPGVANNSGHPLYLSTTENDDVIDLQSRSPVGRRAWVPACGNR